MDLDLDLQNLSFWSTISSPFVSVGKAIAKPFVKTANDIVDTGKALGKSFSELVNALNSLNAALSKYNREADDLMRRVETSNTIPGTKKQEFREKYTETKEVLNKVKRDVKGIEVGKIENHGQAIIDGQGTADTKIQELRNMAGSILDLYILIL